MRLLRTDTRRGLHIDTFTDSESTPPYAILSHRWGKDEVLLDDIIYQRYRKGPKQKYDKIRRCCQQARIDGYQYVWIDTCCIDQRSSSELSEAINSMFVWYKASSICYAYLHDVHHGSRDPRSKGSPFRKSEWFRRGWTLQELIAPAKVTFFDADWNVIGEKTELAETIEAITRVDAAVLCGLVDLGKICIARKMSWAANRLTTKIEDRAYSLLGIFSVNMTTIYGEGKKAFLRLQHEIIRQSVDHSIFAWEFARTSGSENDFQGLLASSPDQFSNSANIIATPYSLFAEDWGLENPVAEFHMTNVGLRIELPLFASPLPNTYVAALACKKPLLPSEYRAVGLVLTRHSGNRYMRTRAIGLVNADCLTALGAPYTICELFADGEEKESPPSRAGKVKEEARRPKGIKLVISAHTIRMLREQHGYRFNQELSHFQSIFTRSQLWDVPGVYLPSYSSLDSYISYETPLSPHIAEDKEDSNLVITFPMVSGRLDQFVLRLCFVNSHTKLWLPLTFDPIHAEPKLEKFTTLPVFGEQRKRLMIAKHPVTRRENMDGLVHQSISFVSGPTVDLVLTTTGLTAQKVTYILDIKLRSTLCLPLHTLIAFVLTTNQQNSPPRLCPNVGQRCEGFLIGYVNSFQGLHRIVLNGYVRRLQCIICPALRRSE